LSRESTSKDTKKILLARKNSTGWFKSSCGLRSFLRQSRARVFLESLDLSWINCSTKIEIRCCIWRRWSARDMMSLNLRRKSSRREE
jgi:hypothetical protein